MERKAKSFEVNTKWPSTMKLMYTYGESPDSLHIVFNYVYSCSCNFINAQSYSLVYCAAPKSVGAEHMEMIVYTSNRTYSELKEYADWW